MPTQNIARGSRSRINWKVESSYGVLPSSTGWNSLPITSETLDENIAPVEAQDIRPDRMLPMPRGGNIASNGTLVHDFGPMRGLTFLQHFLAATASTTIQQLTLSPLATDSVAYTLGQTVSSSATPAKNWTCTTAGTASTGLAAALTGTSPVTSGGAAFALSSPAAVASGTPYAEGVFVSGASGSIWLVSTAGTTGGSAPTLTPASPVTGGTAVFTCIYAGLIADSTAYTRGQVVCDSSGNSWTCSMSGTTSTGSNAALVGTASVVLGTAVFQYAAPAATELFMQRMKASTNWPSVGIAIEKGIIGGDTAQYIQYLGCRVNQVDLAIAQATMTKATYNLVVGNTINAATTSGSGTPTLTAEAPFTGHSAFVSLNDPTATADRSVKDFSMTLTNQADESVYVLGSRQRTAIPEGIRKASGRLTMHFMDATEYTLFKNETIVPLRASLCWKGMFLAFDFPEVKLLGNGSPKIGGPGVLTADFDWNAGVENGTQDLTVTAINTLSALL